VGQRIIDMTASSARSDARAAAFRDFHESTYSDVVRFIERRGFDHESEDIAATAFTVAWRRFDDRPDDARPWVFGIARNVMANAHRGRTRKKALEVRVQSELDVLSTFSTESIDARLDVTRAWQTLSASDQEVLSLIAFEGLTPEEGANVLGTKRTTFAMRLARARKRLKNEIESQNSRRTDADSRRKSK
jgi:RNA polymerase sigma factor (sigma-70 family)